MKTLEMGSHYRWQNSSYQVTMNTPKNDPDMQIYPRLFSNLHNYQAEGKYLQ